MAAKRAHRSIRGLARVTRGRSLAALSLAAVGLSLAACGGGGQEPEVVLAEDDKIELDESELEVDPRDTAEATAKLQLVPGGTATPVNNGIFSGGRTQEGETFGFRSDGGSSSEGFSIGGGGSGLGGGTSFGSSNATSGGSEALSAAGRAVSGAGRAAAGAGSDLADSAGVGASDLVGAAASTPTGAAAAAAAAAGSGEGESFGFRSDGGDTGQSGSFGFRSDGGGATPPASSPRSGAVVPGSAIETTPGAVSVPSGGGATGPGIAAAGEGFGQRVDQPTSRLPKSFGYAGPPRPEDLPGPNPVATPAASATPPASASDVPIAAQPATPLQGGAVDTPLPPLSKTLPPTTPAPSPTPAAGRPTPRGASGLLFGCAPAGRPGAPPRLRMLRPGPTGVQSVAFVCLPAGVRPRFDGWRNRTGVTRITQTSDAGDIYEIPMSLARRAGVGLPSNVLARNPELRARPEQVTGLRGFTATDATVSRIVRRPRATFAEITPRALARVPVADLNRVARSAWADLRVRDLRKLPAARWSQIDRRVIAAVPPSRRKQLSQSARRAIAARGL